jgi:hypothetical protein
VVEKWKIVLVVIWFGIELLFTKVLGLNLSGYGMNQISILSVYERLIYEFVEKGKGNIGAGLAPEVKILLFTVVGAIIFLIIKYISNWMGPMVGNALQGLINHLVSGDPTPVDVSHINHSLNNNLPHPPGNNNAQNMPIPDVPNFLGGLNITNLIQGLGGMFGGGAGTGGNNNQTNNNTSSTRRRPVYDS